MIEEELWARLLEERRRAAARPTWWGKGHAAFAVRHGRLSLWQRIRRWWSG